MPGITLWAADPQANVNLLNIIVKTGRSSHKRLILHLNSLIPHFAEEILENPGGQLNVPGQFFYLENHPNIPCGVFGQTKI